MSNEIVNCFNGKQCIYSTDCPMYNSALGICRLEPLKTYKVEGVPEKPKQEPTPKTQQTPITPTPQTAPDFTAGKYIEVTGTLLDDPIEKTGPRADGTEWRKAGFRMDIAGTTVSVALWDTFSDKGMELVKGNTVHLTSMRVGKPYQGVIQLGSGKYTEITKQ